ncbi:MAG: endo alpha-1,4 polygalactosaminidase [Myxococcota bacterium]|nr:endo alpha-1,4 polygalactosaminidase [Myxococcota bacterium]
MGWMPRLAPTCVVMLGLGAVAACKGSPLRPDAQQDATAVDAFELPWWTPSPGEARNWDIQLTPPFDLTTPRAMYMLDLWDVVPAPMMLDYGDGDPVSVPAGELATAIATLKAQTPPAIVICHVDTGAIHLDDPDARKFPGFEATPPNRPTNPAANSVIGWSTTETGTIERFLDVRADSRARFAAILFERFDLAKAIGCDGVATDRNDAVAYESTIGHGFGSIPIREHTSWSVEVAAQAHQRELSAGMRNGYTITAQSDELSDDFDFLVADRCAEHGVCDQARPFINKARAVFAIDYFVDEDGEPLTEMAICTRWAQGQIQDGVIKDAALSSAVRETCD